MGPEKLSAEYDRIYEEADKLLKEYNPCQFEDDKCIFNRITEDAYKNRGIKICEGPFSEYTTSNGCCDSYSCKYIRPKGCTIKALGCKFYRCSYLWGQDLKEFHTRMSMLVKKARKVLPFGVTHCCVTKEKFLSQADLKEKTDGIT